MTEAPRTELEMIQGSIDTEYVCTNSLTTFKSKPKPKPQLIKRLVQKSLGIKKRKMSGAVAVHAAGEDGSTLVSDGRDGPAGRCIKNLQGTTSATYETLQTCTLGHCLFYLPDASDDG